MLLRMRKSAERRCMSFWIMLSLVSAMRMAIKKRPE